MDRAEAIKAFLRAGGYAEPIIAEGRGESQPYKIPYPERFSEDERNQMHRRVELIR